MMGGSKTLTIIALFSVFVNLIDLIDSGTVLIDDVVFSRLPT